MNWGMNVLGQGNRANATIGRALQLIVRNVGGGIPGDLDRATFGGPGKFTFCFAEDETDPTWEPLSVSRGMEPGQNAVTLFQGDGVQGFIDQRSNTPEQITRSLASALIAVGHPSWLNSQMHCWLFRQSIMRSIEMLGGVEQRSPMRCMNPCAAPAKN